MKIKLSPCEYRREDEYLGLVCIKTIVHGNGELEPCDGCNTNWEETMLAQYKKEKNND